jgi:nucleoside-diphosphate-sugar epimerase
VNILVIGGTRFIGAHTVKHLSDLGHEITTFHRGKSNAEFLPDQIKHIHGDRKDLSNFQPQLASLKPDLILDCCAFTEDHAHEFVKATRGLDPRVVLLSSGDVYRAYGILNRTEEGPYQDVPVSEEADLRTVLYPYRGESPRSKDDPSYWKDHYDKIPVERIFTQNFKTTILRLPAVYGPGDHRPWNYLKRMLDGRQVILLGQQAARWRFIRGYVTDVADAIVKAILNDVAAERIYNVGESESGTELEWVEEIATAVAWDGEIRIVPDQSLPGHLLFSGDSKQHLTYDTTRIRTELGREPQIGRAEGLRKTVEWERANPPETFDTSQFDYDAEDDVISKNP